LPGVSAPPPFGGSARSIVVNLKPDRLRAYRLTPDEVVTAITQANVISPSGNMPLGGRYPMVPLNSVVRNIKDLESVPIRAGTYPAIFLRDVGEVADASDIVTSYALVNGRRTVYIPVTKRADASTLSVVNLVKKNLPKFQSVVPADVKVSYEFDQSPYVTRSIRGLTLEGGLGAVFTGLMILLFLRDWRSAFIVVINIPLSLCSALLALWVSGQTVNIMTLGGLALAVGILVDEATVSIENIHAHLIRGASLRRAARDATNETTVPRLLAMLAVLAMFVPTLFMSGAARAMFLPLSLSVGFSMIASYVISTTLVPILSVWFLRGHEPGQQSRGDGSFSRFQTRYSSALSRAVRLRWLVLGTYAVVVAAIIWFVGGRLGTEIFPRVEGGQLQVRLRAPAGSQVDRTEAIALQALDIIKTEVGTNNIQITLAFVGVHAPSYPINLIYLWNGGSEEGVLQVQLKHGATAAISDLQERLRKAFAQQLPDVSFSFERSDIISRVMSLGSPTPIEVAVSGPTLAADREFAERVKEALGKIESLRDVQFGQSLDYPIVDVAVNRERAGLMGIKMSDVSRSLVPATSSSRFTVPNYWADPNSGVAYQLQVQVPQARMNSLEEAKNLPIAERGGEPVLLRNLAQVTERTAVGEYDRYNMQRTISVTANISGADLGAVTKQVAHAIKALGDPPPKVTVTVRGQVVPLEQMLDGLRTGLLLAIAVIFLLLAANFQSFKLSLIVLSTIPAVVAGVAIMLWLTHTSINIQSFMGAIMAVGVAVANSILLVTFAERSRLDGKASDAAGVEGAATRLRPILMTSVAMIAGMLPMALGLGEAGAQNAPLGRAVVGGLAASTLATLFIVPSVFAVLQARAHRRSASLDPDQEPAS
jgi:multidrug efflux pump subunit AcrB